MTEEKRNYGFSLTEVMVVLAVFTIIMLAIYAILFAGEKNWQTANIKSQLQQSLRNMLDTMIDELRQSAPAQITIGNGADSITFSIPVQAAGMADSENITLNAITDFPLETINYSCPIPTEWGAYTRLMQQQKQITYFYSAANKTLTRRVLNTGGGTVEDFIAARDVENVSFIRPANTNRVTIAISCQKLTLEQYPVVYNVITSVNCENSSAL